ncbi:hypothetical protein PGT21_017866 [Puccinia graminis f. sp. tritici]|uniref:Uncharacterized protein n=1 Tax=Puccinia graminis f. sp. tritici TaxID=56615 RepID=A0A5B0NAK7_PUCGR|nr:hypothetical protein PGT21_017866 [Puccinia graminis f. sp. tritici]KAA1136140.1 hypothetical protein PGTUg99_033393 [Puccinia graminis f. sp. tritici]
MSTYPYAHLRADFNTADILEPTPASDFFRGLRLYFRWIGDRTHRIASILFHQSNRAS